jgi:hypothetical protein
VVIAVTTRMRGPQTRCRPERVEHGRHVAATLHQRLVLARATMPERVTMAHRPEELVAIAAWA